MQSRSGSRFSDSRPRETAASLPTATHEGVLQLGDARIPCAALSDGTRVLSQDAALQAIGLESNGFALPSNIQPFASELLPTPWLPLVGYITESGEREIGLDCSVFSALCFAYIAAGIARATTASQKHVLFRCAQLQRAFCAVGMEVESRAEGGQR